MTSSIGQSMGGLYKTFHNINLLIFRETFSQNFKIYPIGHLHQRVVFKINTFEFKTPLYKKILHAKITKFQIKPTRND
jgi:hypothetical protein